MVRVPLKLFPYYLEGRLFEWVMAISMIGLAIEVFIWPQTLEESAFQWMVVVVNPKFIGAILLIGGSVRIVALILNGVSLSLGPRLRSVCAIVGAMLWIQFGTALVKLSIDQGFASPGIPFWYTFTLAELYVTYRAALDVRLRN